MAGTKRRPAGPKMPVVHARRGTGKVRITVFRYGEAGFWEKTLWEDIDDLGPGDGEGVTWVNVDGVHQPEVIKTIGSRFNLHPLLLEAVQDTQKRPKVEDYGEYLYFSLKMFYLNEKKRRIVTEHVSIVLGRSYVISFQEMEGDVFGPIREKIRRGGSTLLQQNADCLAYALVDAIVDNYFTILEKLGDKIEDLDMELVTAPSQGTLYAIHAYKREMIYLRKSVWPLREVIAGLERSESPLLQRSTGIYLRDVYDRTMQVIDTVETYRDLFSGMLEIYLSSISNRMNEIMKVLTIISTIFIPLSFIASIYGMNFAIPELRWAWGYPLVLTVMLAIAAGMLEYFRRKKWL